MEGFIKIAKICDDYDTWLVRVLSPYWEDLGRYASIDVAQNVGTVMEGAKTHEFEGHSVIVMAVASFIGASISISGAFTVVHDFEEHHALVSAIYPGFRRNRPEDAHHLEVMRWFLFELCRLDPWKDLPSRVMNDMSVPRPIEQATLDDLNNNEWKRAFDEAVKHKRLTMPGQSMAQDADLAQLAERRMASLVKAGIFTESTSSSLSGNPISFHVLLPRTSVDARHWFPVSVRVSWKDDGRGWRLRDPDYAYSNFAHSEDIVDSLIVASMILAAEEKDAWFEANVAMEGDQDGDICEVVLDIEVEPYLLLDQQVPYLWSDEDFVGYLQALERA